MTRSRQETVRSNEGTNKQKYKEEGRFRIPMNSEEYCKRGTAVQIK